MHLQRYSEGDTFKKNQAVTKLMDYSLRKEEVRDISESETVEDEDASRLMRMVVGGYVDDDFATHLSYNDFQEKKEEFGVLKNIYQSIHRKYKNKRIEEGKLKFRSMLLMVYLEENIAKMTKGRVEEIFSRNRIVW